MTSERFEYTQNIIVRMDLRMSRGKLCGQVAHAAVAAAEEARKRRQDWWHVWMREGQRKIVLKVKNLEELVKLRDHAEELRLPTATVQDRGLTELPPGTVTCIGIGPAPSGVVDKISKQLPLL
ncbi:MAG: peptidyl-tRNA hydrolase Pth2 [Candidatus Bathyarchaeia archaeon]